MRIRFPLFPVLVAIGLLGCRPPETALRIGTNVWPGYELAYLARSFGYYQGYPIRLVEFSSAAEVVRAYHSGLLEGAMLTADEAIAAVQGGGEHRIVLVCDFSNGADVLLAQPQIQSIQDLKGRRVGVETQVLGAYVLARALERGGLSAADVQVVQVPLAEHEIAFHSGRVDAVVTFEPHLTRLVAGGARRLFDSAEIPGEIVDVLLARQKLSRPQYVAMTALVRGWFRALHDLQKNPQAAGAHMALREQVTTEQFLASLKRLEIPDRPANLRMLGGSTNNLTPVLRNLCAMMLKEKIVNRALAPPPLDDGFIRAAER